MKAKFAPYQVFLKAHALFPLWGFATALEAMAQAKAHGIAGQTVVRDADGYVVGTV